MERLIVDLADRLARGTSRRGFLSKTSRAILVLGGGLAGLGANEARLGRQAAAGSCPICTPPNGVWCSNNCGGLSCPSSHSNNYYTWTCCVDGWVRWCMDCRDDATGAECGCMVDRDIRC